MSPIIFALQTVAGPRGDAGPVGPPVILILIFIRPYLILYSTGKQGLYWSQRQKRS